MVIQNVDFYALSERNKMDIRERVASNIAIHSSTAANDISVALVSGSVRVDATMSGEYNMHTVAAALAANKAALELSVLTDMATISGLPVTGVISVSLMPVHITGSNQNLINLGAIQPPKQLNQTADNFSITAASLPTLLPTFGAKSEDSSEGAKSEDSSEGDSARAIVLIICAVCICAFALLCCSVAAFKRRLILSLISRQEMGSWPSTGEEAVPQSPRSIAVGDTWAYDREQSSKMASNMKVSSKGNPQALFGVTPSSHVVVVEEAD
jgi:hypothetical protein